MAKPHHKKNDQRRQQKLLLPAFWFIPNERAKKHKRSSILSLVYSSLWLPWEEAQCCPHPTITSSLQTWIFQSFIGPQASSPASTHNVKLCLISSAQNQLALSWPGKGVLQQSPHCVLWKSHSFMQLQWKWISYYVICVGYWWYLLMITQIL